MIRSALIAATLAFAAPAMAMDEPPSPASADPPPATDTADDVADAPRDRIIVRGRRSDGQELRAYIQEFVLEIGEPTGQYHPLARWRDEICVLVHDFPEDAAEFIAAEVSRVAREVGLEAGDQGCAPNLLIFFTDDGAGMASAMLERRPDALAPLGGVEGATQGPAALADFTSSDRAVRWWQTTAVLDRYGQLVVQDLSHGRGNRPVERDIASYIRVPPDAAFLATYIIVDATKLEGVSWRQLTDYLAMVALVQVDPDAIAVGYDSILNLFNAEPAPPRMTEWDRSYLHSLYSLGDHLHPRTQQNRIIEQMANGASAADED